LIGGEVLYSNYHVPQAQYLQFYTFHHLRSEYKFYIILKTNMKANKAEKRI